MNNTILCRPLNGGGDAPFCLDGEVQKFLEETANSLLKLELIGFFHRNPSTLDIVENISSRIGRSPKKVAKGIEDLVKAGYIDKYRRENFVLYGYTKGEEKRKLAEKLMRCYDDRTERLKIITKILKGGEF